MVTIRAETRDDYEAIEQVTIAAFAGKEYSGGDEQLIIRRLRAAGALALSLVTETDGMITGHIAFSVVKINGEDRGWYGLGPVSVLPTLQKQGIGSALIREGLARIRAMGAKGGVLEGDPQYYQRFGFKNYPGLIYEGALSAIYFMALPFYNEVPGGKVEFHPAFYTEERRV
jgi:putative acetyltransferase